MRNLSRGTWLALVAATAVPATFAIAATAEKGGWHRMSPESRARLDEGKLALAKAALKLTPDQEKLWVPIETQVRDNFKAREERRAEWKKKREERRAARSDKSDNSDVQKRERPNMAERFEKMSQRLSERADRFKAFSTAFTPFYASLNEEQKEVLRPVMRELMPGMGRHGRHGPRWAMGGGWGPGGRHDGHHRHHGWFDRGGPGDAGPGGQPHGGPGVHDDGPDDNGAAPPPAAPDDKG